MKKIPYGIIDYKKLQENDYCYVDKTMYLQKLEDIGSTLIYLRPGRFGKSLFTSMMYYYYDVNSESLFESLFKSTYVYENPTKNKNNYYVLKFDFSGITTADKDKVGLEGEFSNKVKDGILKFMDSYHFHAEISYDTLSPNAILLNFLRFFDSLKLEHKLYILIDEYDNFTNAILSGDGDRFKNIVGNEGFVKSFYAQIKEYVGLGVIDRVFITGICPITMDSMTTGFNIATDLSTDIRFSSMIGLTHDEVLNLMDDIKEEKREELYKLMIKNYDGYLFSVDSEERVFNATLVMYFLKNYYDFQKVPRELIDKNIVVNFGKIENLVKLQNNTFYKELIDSLLNTEEISGELKTSFNLESDFTRDDIISLLYYFGYLTIKEDGIGNKVNFKIPNYVMKETYYRYFLKMLRDENITIDDTRREEYLIEIIKNGKITKVSDYVSELLEYMSKRGLRNFQERNIQSLYFALLFEAKEYHLYTEYECKNGFIDFLITPNKEYMDYTIMIEFKYIKKEDYSKKLLEEKRILGESQLMSYSEDERIEKEHLKRYLVIFVGSECKLIEEV